MPEIGTLGLMSGDGKRSAGHRPQATAPILDSTLSTGLIWLNFPSAIGEELSWLSRSAFTFWSASVTGFGCRPYTDLDAVATGPAFESRQGRKARVWGTRFSGRYGDLAGAVGAA